MERHNRSRVVTYIWIAKGMMTSAATKMDRHWRSQGKEVNLCTGGLQTFKNHEVPLLGISRQRHPALCFSGMTKFLNGTV